mmetsp:Transcript_43120/g.121937  ORF Transcript_43120/g.121937 Transcript_43120/m.121937 type:complete len:300 (-) Transcript_43120:99-998(-)
MVVSTASRARVDELESVQIQLTLEGAKAALAEVERHDFLEELVGLVDGKGASVGHKRNDVRSARGFHFEQESVQLLGERLDDSASHPSAAVSVEEGVRGRKRNVSARCLEAAHGILVHHEAFLQQIGSEHRVALAAHSRETSHAELVSQGVIEPGGLDLLVEVALQDGSRGVLLLARLLGEQRVVRSVVLELELLLQLLESLEVVQVEVVHASHAAHLRLAVHHGHHRVGVSHAGVHVHVHAAHSSHSHHAGVWVSLAQEGRDRVGLTVLGVTHLLLLLLQLLLSSHGGRKYLVVHHHG